MSATLLWKALALWLAILVLAVGNGAFREAVLIPHLGKSTALVTSGILLSGLVLCVALAGASWGAAAWRENAWSIGVLWLALTLLFEFGFGRLQGKPWSELFEAYAFKDFNIWPLVLLVTLTAPWLASRALR